DTDPCTPVEAIDSKFCWYSFLNFAFVPSPMKEKQFCPALVHNWTLARRKLAFNYLPHYPLAHWRVGLGIAAAIARVGGFSGSGPGTISTFAPTPTFEKSRMISAERIRTQPKLAGLPMFRSSGVP